MERTVKKETVAGSGRIKGKLVEWIDSKGYGWVEAEHRRYFAHIKAFQRGRGRPQQGDEVEFLPGLDEQRRPRAAEIRNLSRNRAGQIEFGTGLIWASLILLPLLSALKISLPLAVLPIWWLAASAVTWMLYSIDKKRAEKGQWRIPEIQLHLSELIGGWPGGLLARRRFRHKTRKWSFQLVSWSIISLWQVASLLVLFELTNVDRLEELLRKFVSPFSQG